jgi:hypothetical protein
MRVVSSVLPFRVNDYVIKELIDWSRVPDDPIFSAHISTTAVARIRSTGAKIRSQGPISTIMRTSGPDCGGSRSSWASSLTTCLWSGIPAQDTTLKSRCMRPGRSIGGRYSRFPSRPGQPEAQV